MMDGPQRNINAADLNHFKCKCLSCGVMQMRTEWERLKLFPPVNANMFFLTLLRGSPCTGGKHSQGMTENEHTHTHT